MVPQGQYFSIPFFYYKFLKLLKGTCTCHVMMLVSH